MDVPIFWPRNISRKFRKLSGDVEQKSRDFIKFPKSPSTILLNLSVSLFLCRSLCQFLTVFSTRRVETRGNRPGPVLSWKLRDRTPEKINYCHHWPSWNRSFPQGHAWENPIFPTRPAVPIRGSTFDVTSHVVEEFYLSIRPLRRNGPGSQDNFPQRVEILKKVDKFSGT